MRNHMHFRIVVGALCLTVAMAAETFAQQIPQIPENHIGLRDEELIREDLAQDGIDTRSVVIRGDKAHVAVRIEGRPVVLEIDRLDGERRVLYTLRPVPPRIVVPTVRPRLRVVPQ